MNQVLIYESLLEVSLLVMLAEALNALITRYGYPRIVSEILIGLLLGPYSLGGLLNSLFHVTLFTINDYILFLASFSIMLLLFASGLEHGISTLRQGGVYGVLAAVFGAVVPYALVYFLLSILGFNTLTAIYMALSTAPTSLAVVAGIIEREGLQGLPSTRVLITAASIDDVVTLIMLSIIPTLNSPSASTVIYDVLRIVTLWFLFLALSLAIIPRLMNMVSEGLVVYTSLVVLFGLVLAMAVMGFSEVIASFIAGLAVAESKYSGRVREFVDILIAIFGSIFFITIGLETKVTSFLNPSILITAALVSLTALIAKLIGVYPFAYLKLRSTKQALDASLGMIPRGEMGLVVASLGLSLGVLTDYELGIVVFMVLFTTIVGAILYKRSVLRGG
ncbi:cation:proton antiporter [Vulcanisaeta thermophila]|uniref:cation:proton antiporter n=1 Tax=Vulcanisaeta thermophila TaxID=867917 RepID=UPI000852E1BF|nr:cation:proton antiporter [Vulcanisaeta thermophila]